LAAEVDKLRAEKRKINKKDEFFCPGKDRQIVEFV